MIHCFEEFFNIVYCTMPYNSLQWMNTLMTQLHYIHFCLYKVENNFFHFISNVLFDFQIKLKEMIYFVSTNSAMQSWYLIVIQNIVDLTFRPASLLCKFIRGCAFFGLFLLFLLSLASTKVLEKVIPKSTLSLLPLHWKINCIVKI